MKIGIQSFPARFSALQKKGKCELHNFNDKAVKPPLCVVDRWQLDSKAERLLRCPLTQTTSSIKLQLQYYNYNYFEVLYSHTVYPLFHRLLIPVLGCILGLFFDPFSDAV